MRPLAVADSEALHNLFISPGVRRFLWDDIEIPYATTQDIIAESGRLLAVHGYGIWVAHDAQATLLGLAGYWRFPAHPNLELLYAVDPAYWGKELAVELARAVLDYGFTELGFERVYASTDVANQASVRVLEKLGFSLDERRRINGLDTVFYSLPAADCTG